MPKQKSKLYMLPAFCTLIPLLAVHISWMTATLFELIDPCFPYWSDCVSISRTARHYPASLVFKGMMIPSAVLTTYVWYLTANWLTSNGFTGKSPLWIKGLSLIAGVFMIIYLIALGVHGEEFRFARRTGVIIAFSFTFLNQLLLYRKLWSNRGLIHLNPWILFFQKWICSGLLTIGLLNVLLDLFYADFYRWNDAIEWWFALLLYGFFMTIAAAWKQTGFSVNQST